ncbi:MAG: hypothetical protein ACD_17C00525G0003 [uncultured bacterium]|nr:MAG: hypothetical protein ACD_17C00525G0003 [uncultured bacterium]OGN56504.1 MAG: aminoacyl-tRNA hydrolase [Chlamydiae bacterium RIFCSPHIGHO2_01_FULL_44_39]OGN57022.1 MAG: aminoacyl-tRNA hydrolase [Chlamydiae bacterium RIFCSPHIGHO2_02_FULL_45_9]OGN61008.1 MAG: aminoacyl-tRNA hydrolase [Chlamydiae bacterium RIFCSPHIGHO2_12_FULL_44_59]OGN66784.1 MAG: aminoacyl-tRNA hydrolase [Chlamydiae bacterium RIFCSPLOWO2_01_FULL_44_52]OGN69978.1 MAG: aminoacyl-tRNA hydrolase [Chlamydiae bacterium RIFCSPLO
MSHEWLVVGLGNLGSFYDETRHNVGFEALDLLARKYNLSFQSKSDLKGLIAKGTLGGASVLMLKPQTYMNLSGHAVVAVMNYYKIELSRLLVLADDAAIPFGELRIRANSSSGGHNGLKSVEEAIHTDGYARLRIGVGSPEAGDLSDYVLGQFSKEEKKLLPEILGRVVQAVEIWLDKGLTSAMNYANRSSTPSIGEEQHDT